MTHSIRLFSLLIAFAFLASCSGDTDVWLDSGDLTGTGLRLVEIDTFQIEMSTFKYDSLINDSESRLLVGRYVDPIFGEVKSEAFLELVPSTYYIPDAAVFDSIVLNVAYDGYFYNDTLVPQHLEVRQLTETINLDNGVSYYYNTANFETSSELLVNKTFLPRISKDSITATVSSLFGQDIFTKLQNGTLSDAESFTEYFKGIKISPSDSDDGSIIGYTAGGTYMRIYYSIEGDVDDDNYLDLKLNSAAEVIKYVNRITGNRAGTPVSGLGLQQNDVDSGSMQDLSYVQGGIGIATKITFPTIRSIKEINDNEGAIFKANLKLRVNPAYYNDKLYPSDSMYVGIVSQNNSMLRLLTDASGANVMAYIDRENPEYNEIYLIVPVSEFLNKSISSTQYLNYGLILLPMNYNTTATRTVLNGPKNPDYQSKLELTYAIYD
ncbi:MAG: DUF4270 family protein [Flavobacterium sp.]|uniref:DUF4270 family protein n=1 Tax=Flavobacterium sp. TaxID=239 RepID=UPI00120D11EC|nr:DUF4270 family protein [Flavobacterium sp.]RZJ67640.1 MAG: DUF4270 family protein [Flavobacterium sp.]